MRLSDELERGYDMVALQQLLNYTNDFLKIKQFRDYCPNGLQVEGRAEVNKVVSGVTASLDLIDAAIEREADVLLVHHGYFWKGEDSVVQGMKRRRLKRLLENDVSLVAYHLPLDAHAEIGNNACLGGLLDFVVERPLNREGVGLVGSLPEPVNITALAHRIANALGREPLVIASGPEEIRRVGWCTGAAQSYLPQAVELGLDAFITGEISEQTVHVARESGIHFIAAGHHATERYGVMALGELWAEEFGVEHEFVDIDNPV